MTPWLTEEASRRRASTRSRAASDDVKPGESDRLIVIALRLSSACSNGDELTTSSSSGGESVAEYVRGVRVDRLGFEPELCNGLTVA
jgi:hypothetical protein